MRARRGRRLLPLGLRRGARRPASREPRSASSNAHSAFYARATASGSSGVITDNGSAYVSDLHRLACQRLGDPAHPHRAPAPTGPGPTAKQSGFIQTLTRRWAYGAASYSSSAERTRAPSPAGSTTTTSDDHTEASATNQTRLTRLRRKLLGKTTLRAAASGVHDPGRVEPLLRGPQQLDAELADLGRASTACGRARSRGGG